MILSDNLVEAPRADPVGERGQSFVAGKQVDLPVHLTDPG